MESPAKETRSASESTRSKIASATVLSSIKACQFAIGYCEAMTVEWTPMRSSTRSSSSREEAIEIGEGPKSSIYSDIGISQ